MLEKNKITGKDIFIYYVHTMIVSMTQLTETSTTSLQEILSTYFGEDFQEDDKLNYYIKRYKTSDGMARLTWKDTILTRFLANRPNEFDSDKFIDCFPKFITQLDNSIHQEISKNLLKSLDIKLFRQQENNLKAKFILDNSDITLEILSIANKVSNLNSYHNFGHQLGTAETAIKLAQYQNLSRSEINLLALVSLFHDAGYNTIPSTQMEEKSYETAIQNLSEDIFQKLGVEKSEFYRLIIATKLDQHGKIEDQLVKIIQDADLGSLGRGPYYLLYSAMGILEENNIIVEKFVDSENELIQNKKEIDGNFFLSEGGRNILKDPEQALNIIKGRPSGTIQEAYRLRKEDITFNEFIKIIDTYIQKNSS